MSMRGKTYVLEDAAHPQGGITVRTKSEKDCVFCRHCTDVFWDYSNLIWGISCELNREEAGTGNEAKEHTCMYFEDDL